MESALWPVGGNSDNQRFEVKSSKLNRQCQMFIILSYVQLGKDPRVFDFEWKVHVAKFHFLIYLKIETLHLFSWCWCLQHAYMDYSIVLLWYFHVNTSVKWSK